VILNNSQNRKIIFDYLNKVSENDFIEEIIIPLFSSQGYTLLRINAHTAGERGKDIIFYRHVELFQDIEYIAIQAKTKEVNTKNVTEIANQLIRTLKTSFQLKAGIGLIKPNYAMLINARRHSNDATSELPDLVENNQNIKILSQENVCELIIKSGIAPEKLLSNLALELKNSSDDESDRMVREIILNNKPKEIDELFEHKLKYIKNEISDEIKALAIDYIFDLWNQDSSWEGTVKPLRWLWMYFDFIQERQYRFLKRVLEEYISPTPSFEAKPYTLRIVHLMTTEHYKTFINDLIFLSSININAAKQRSGINVLFHALADLLRNKLIKDEKESEKARLLVEAFNAKINGKEEKFDKYMKDYEKLIWI